MFVGSVVAYYILGGTTISYGAAFTVISSVVLIVATLILYPCIKKVVKKL
jgi:zinc transporter ZupT